MVLTAISLTTLPMFSQNGNNNGNGLGNTHWKINGNNADSTSYIGTANNQDLIFKSNNIEGLRLDGDADVIINGDLTIKSLEDLPLTTNRLLSIQPNGKIVISSLTIPQDDTYVCSYTTPWVYADGTATDEIFYYAPILKV